MRASYIPQFEHEGMIIHNSNSYSKQTMQQRRLKRPLTSLYRSSAVLTLQDQDK